MTSIREHATKLLDDNLKFLASIKSQLDVGELDITEKILDKILDNSDLDVPNDYMVISNIREKYDNAYHHLMITIRKLDKLESGVKSLQLKAALRDQFQNRSIETKRRGLMPEQKRKANIRELIRWQDKKRMPVNQWTVALKKAIDQIG